MHTRLRTTGFVALLFAAAHANADATAMAPGVLVDEAAARAVVADANGYARAVSLADGTTTWSSNDVAFPLLETRGSVVALGRSDVRGAGLLLLLDAATGAVQDRIAFEVPDEVRASVVPVPQSTFEAVAEATAQGARIHWRSTAAPLRGAVLEEGEGEPTVATGAFDLVLDGAQHMTIPRRGVVDAPLLPPPDLPAAERVPGLGERQFRSHGDLAAMSAAAVADERFGTAWRWTVRMRGTGDAIAGPTLPYAYLPFAVLDGLLVYRSEPVLWRNGDRMDGHGARIVAWDLASDRERWHLDVFDPVYRGPLPP